MKKKLKKYKVIKCKNCGRISVSWASKTFKCRYCGKSYKIFKKSTLGLGVILLKSFNHPKNATEFCKIAKDLEKNNGKLTDSGFYNY
jgi:hypothetical protein